MFRTGHTEIMGCPLEISQIGPPNLVAARNVSAITTLRAGSTERKSKFYPQARGFRILDPKWDKTSPFVAKE